MLSGSGEKPPRDAQPRFELGPALQQADVPPSELSRTLNALRRTLLRRPLPLNSQVTHPNLIKNQGHVERGRLETQYQHTETVRRVEVCCKLHVLYLAEFDERRL